MPGTITIKPAEPSQAAELTALAHAAKARWGYHETLMSLWADELTFTEDFIENHPVFVAESDGEVIGVYALIKEGRTASLDDMWVHPRSMKSGVGRALFEHAVKTAREIGAETLEIVSDPYAEGFYMRMGARRVGSVPSKPPGRELPQLFYDLTEPK